MKDFKDWGIRIRKGPGYYALWFNLKTIRLDMGPVQPLPPEKSEFYDVGITSRCNAFCDFCLTENSEISTDNNKTKIINIKPGDIVKSYNTKLNKIENNKVSQIFCREYNGDLIDLELENGISLKLTPNHKVFTTNRGWIKAEELTENDDVITI